MCRVCDYARERPHRARKMAYLDVAHLNPRFSGVNEEIHRRFARSERFAHSKRGQRKKHSVNEKRQEKNRYTLAQEADYIVNIGRKHQNAVSSVLQLPRETRKNSQ